MHKNDFRGKSFGSKTLVDSAKYAGNRFYYKLFVIENSLRIIINTVLLNEYPKDVDWWREGVRPKFKKDWHNFSTHHGIYHVYLEQLNIILADNDKFISPHIKNLDILIGDIQIFNSARRKIAHTKYINMGDLKSLDDLYDKCKKIIVTLSQKFKIVIP